MKPSNFDNDLNWSEKISDSAEIREAYEKKLNTKIIKRVKIKSEADKKLRKEFRELYLQCKTQDENSNRNRYRTTNSK